MKTHTIKLTSIKDPDEFGDLVDALDLPEELVKKHLQFREYANLELEVDENLQIVRGRFLPVK